MLGPCYVPCKHYLPLKPELHEVVTVYVPIWQKRELKLWGVIKLVQDHAGRKCQALPPALWWNPCSQGLVPLCLVCCLFFVLFLLEYSWFAVLCQFLLYRKTVGTQVSLEGRQVPPPSDTAHPQGCPCSHWPQTRGNLLPKGAGSYSCRGLERQDSRPESYTRDGFFFFFLFLFRAAHGHMEVPRLGVDSELQLPAYATATPDPYPTERGQDPHGY